MQKTLKQKRVQIQNLLAISLSFFSLLFFCNSCYEPIEGCLDINSSNYEVSADRACDSCCMFPNFNLNIDHVFNGEDFSLGDTLTNDLGVQFAITDYALIFSAFNLTADEVVLTVADSTKVICNGLDDNYEVNDIIAVENTTSFATIGTWNFAEEIRNISFQLGLSDCYHDAGINQLALDSRISNGIDTLYQPDLGYRTFLIEINDSLRYEFRGPNESINISKVISVSNAAGSPLVLNMNLDLGVWMSDFNFEDDIQTTKTKIVDNTTQAVNFSE